MGCPSFTFYLFSVLGLLQLSFRHRKTLRLLPLQFLPFSLVRVQHARNQGTHERCRSFFRFCLFAFRSCPLPRELSFAFRSAFRSDPLGGDPFLLGTFCGKLRERGRDDMRRGRGRNLPAQKALPETLVDRDLIKDSSKDSRHNQAWHK